MQQTSGSTKCTWTHPPEPKHLHHDALPSVMRHFIKPVSLKDIWPTAMSHRSAMTSTFFTSIHHSFLNHLSKNQLLLNVLTHPCSTTYNIPVYCFQLCFAMNPSRNAPHTWSLITQGHTVCAERARQHLCLRRGSSPWVCQSWRRSPSSRRKRCCSWFECRGQCRNYSSGQGRRRCHGRRAL